MSPLEGLWATETANGGDCWAIFAYFFVFFPLSWPYLQARHYGTPVSPIMGCPPGHGPARDYRVWEPETSPRARARGSLLRNGHGDLPPAGGTRRSDVFPTISRRTPGLPAASPFRGAAAPAFPLILRRVHTRREFKCRRRFAPARSRDRQGAPGYPCPCADDGTCGVRGPRVYVRGKASSPGGLAPGLGGS